MSVRNIINITAGVISQVVTLYGLWVILKALEPFLAQILLGIPYIIFGYRPQRFLPEKSQAD